MPPEETPQEPDWEALAQLAEEAEAHSHAGTYTEKVFNETLVAAKVAAAGNTDVIDFVFLYADPEWLTDD